MSGNRIRRALLLLSALLCLATANGCVVDDAELAELEAELALPPPMNVTATPVSPTRIDVSWSPVNDPTLKYYVLYRGTAPGNETTLTSVPPGRTTFVNNNLTPGQQYCFYMRTVNTSNERSIISNEVCATTPGTSTTPPPTGVTATALSSSRIRVSWNAVSGATSYRIYVSTNGGPFVHDATVNGSTTSFIFANLPPSTSYVYYVTAIAVSGESAPSATASASTLSDGLEGYWKFDEEVGTLVADQSVFARNGTLASAHWSTDRPPVDITRNRSSVRFTTSASSTISVPDNPAFRFTGGDFTVSIWVKRPSSTATFDIVGMRATGCGTLGWKLGHDTGGLYVAHNGATRAFGQALAVNVWSNVTVTYAGTTLTTYVNGTVTSQAAYTASNAITGRPLQFGHMGGCGGGAVLIDEAQIHSRALTLSQVRAISVPPPAPSLTVTNRDASHQVLTWTAVPNATQYFVYKGTAAGNQVYFTSEPTLTFTGQHLTPDTQYSWYVRAEVNKLASVASNQVVLRTPTVLAAPTVTATATSSSRITVSWTAVAGAASYKIYRSTDNVTYVQAGAVVAPTTQLVAANLAANTTYYYKVAAVDIGTNIGTLSAAASATTLP